MAVYFYQMNDVQSSWSERKFSQHKMYGPHSKYRQKIVLTFDCGNGDAIYIFHLHNLPREA